MHERRSAGSCASARWARRRPAGSAPARRPGRAGGAAAPRRPGRVACVTSLRMTRVSGARPARPGRRTGWSARHPGRSARWRRAVPAPRLRTTRPLLDRYRKAARTVGRDRPSRSASCTSLSSRAPALSAPDLMAASKCWASWKYSGTGLVRSMLMTPGGVVSWSRHPARHQAPVAALQARGRRTGPAGIEECLFGHYMYRGANQTAARRAGSDAAEWRNECATGLIHGPAVARLIWAEYAESTAAPWSAHFVPTFSQSLDRPNKPGQTRQMRPLSADSWSWEAEPDVVAGGSRRERDGRAGRRRRRSPELRIGVVLEAFLDRPLDRVLAWLRQAAPEITDIEVGAGGYAPHPHCDVAALLASAPARAAWLDLDRPARPAAGRAERLGKPAAPGPRSGPAA